jgi:hypothetical protein
MLTKTNLNQISIIVQSETLKIVRSGNQILENKMNKKFDKLERKLDYALNFLDRDYLKFLYRVERIEEHLNLEPTSI